VNLYAASYTKQLGQLGSLSLVLSRTTGLTQQTQAQVLFTVPLGPGVSASASVLSSETNGQRTNTASLDVQKPLQVGPGYGYFLHGQTDHQAGAGVSYLVCRARYPEASTVDSVTGCATAAGGIGILGSKLFAVPPIDSSFALVRVGDVPASSHAGKRRRGPHR
jgi:outer membrane usher protein FimD/PapC